MDFWGGSRILGTRDFGGKVSHWGPTGNLQEGDKDIEDKDTGYKDTGYKNRRMHM